MEWNLLEIAIGHIRVYAKDTRDHRKEKNNIKHTFFYTRCPQTIGLFLSELYSYCYNCIAH